MNTSLGALRERLLNFRAWDSSGETFNNRIREAMNTALDRLAGDVPEALIPDEEHIVLLPDVVSTDSTVSAYLRTTVDSLVLRFTDTSNATLGTSAATAWRPTVTGLWDGIMHIEVKDPDGTWHRRQSREWWVDANEYYVTIDRPWRNATDTSMEFRIHQPEFFVDDDVMEVLEPARIWDGSRQQVWAIDTAGASRQDMVDFQGNSKGRPFRFWRGRHFQMPTPRHRPLATLDDKTPWVGPEQIGIFQFCYTIVWGRKDPEWQVAPGGVTDPQWESAPSPVSELIQVMNPQLIERTVVQNGEATVLVEGPEGLEKTTTTGPTKKTVVVKQGGGSPVLRAENIDFMTGFDVAASTRESRSGFRIRFYVARQSYELGQPTPGAADNIVEDAGIFYFLAEVDPATVTPTATFTWTGSVTPDFYRPLKHSTGYYAHKVYPHQDARYELDFRVLRLPRKFIHDSDTAPIQRDAVPALIELSLYYMCLLDGVDQTGAQAHLNRFQELARRYRARYANTGHVVEPVPLGGYYARVQYGTFKTSS
tara:strand:- start:1606 stop:3216 length:1611 start_codon:yes stop_codon:yes gene_type:complete